MTQTPVLGLDLPDEDDYVNVNGDVSGNMTKIDTAFGKILHEAELSVTTSSTGNIKVFDDTDHYIVAANCNNYIALPYVYSNNGIYVKILDRSDLSPKSNTSVTIKYWYFDTLGS